MKCKPCKEKRRDKRLKELRGRTSLCKNICIGGEKVIIYKKTFQQSVCRIRPERKDGVK